MGAGKFGRHSYEELTDDKNIRILGTFTHRGWARMSMAQARSMYIHVVCGAEDLEDLADRLEQYHVQVEGELIPFKDVLDMAMKSSGSLGGEHRRDLKEAIMGSKPMKMGLVDVGGTMPGGE